MRLPQQKKILREDVKDAPNWINPVLDSVNSFMENVYQALNKNITLSENISSFIREITYRTPSTYPSGQEVVEFQNTLKARPIGVQILQIFDRSTYEPAPGPCYIPWIEVNNTIKISTITGLAASKIYTVRLVIY